MPEIKRKVPPPEVAEPFERLAINLKDLDETDPLLRQKLLGGKIALTEIIQVNPEDTTEVAVPFSCKVLTAALACDLLRSESRREKTVPARVYLHNGKKWLRLRQTDVLTVVEEEGKRQRTLLNTHLFPSQIPQVVITGPKPRRVEL